MKAPGQASDASPLRGPIACVDLETTGGHAARHRVIEVGIVLVEDGAVVEEWSSLVQPGCRIPPSIEQFTGISNEMVAEAPSFADLRKALRERLDGRLFVAHNARFDYGFLRREFARLGERFSSQVLCTVKLSRALFPEAGRHNLDALIDRHGLSCAQRHRALGDARVLADLLSAFERAAGPERVAAAAERAGIETRLPAHLPPDLADELPEAPGVYVFRGEGGVPVYVGMSRNLRSRVLGHFAGDSRSARELRLSRLVRDVECIETSGELGALLLESRLVKELDPSENRRLRSAAQLHCIRLVEGHGGLRPVVSPMPEDDAGTDQDLHGPFRSERDARKALEARAREAQLCAKLLGLEDGPGSCFGFQVGRCRGACCGREPLALHDARLRLALAPLRLKAWPFAGPIAVHEGGDRDSGTVHVFDRWRHVASLREPATLDDLPAGVPGGFDPDAYRILARFLAHADSRRIRVLGRRDA